jgi:hypothetical protein
MNNGAGRAKRAPITATWLTSFTPYMPRGEIYAAWWQSLAKLPSLQMTGRYWILLNVSSGIILGRGK